MTQLVLSTCKGVERSQDARVDSARRVEHLSDEWGQPPAEEYVLGAFASGGNAPWVRGRRENEIQDALLEHAERYWLEVGPDREFMWVCARSRRSGKVFRYRCGLRSDIVKWVRWQHQQDRLRATRFERCSCAVREEPCPLCVESWGEHANDGEAYGAA